MIRKPKTIAFWNGRLPHWEVEDGRYFVTIHLFCEIGRKGLKGTLEDFKRWTGHRATQILGENAARFWQREWFDHWSRSDAEDEKIIRYIRNNPVKAGLAAASAGWPYSSCSRPLP